MTFLLGVIGACTLPVTDAIQTSVVINRSDQEVVVYLDHATGEQSIMELMPGEDGTTDFSPPTDGCAPAKLIARDRTGNEVDRQEPPFCIRDHWEIHD